MLKRILQIMDSVSRLAPIFPHLPLIVTYETPERHPTHNCSHYSLLQNRLCPLIHLRPFFFGFRRRLLWQIARLIANLSGFIHTRLIAIKGCLNNSSIAIFRIMLLLRIHQPVSRKNTHPIPYEEELVDSSPQAHTFLLSDGVTKAQDAS